VDEEIALDLLAVENGPASAPRRVHFVMAVPREFDDGLPVSCPFTVLNVASNVTKLKRAELSWSELAEAFYLGINEVLRPRCHPRDSPASNERTLRLGFHRHVLVSLGGARGQPTGVGSGPTRTL